MNEENKTNEYSFLDHWKKLEDSKENEDLDFLELDEEDEIVDTLEDINKEDKKEEVLEEIEELPKMKEAVNEVIPVEDDSVAATIIQDIPAVNIPVEDITSKEEESDMPSMIKMYGEVLTDKEYVTNPAIARDEEINKMILALITPDKSALLVGKPGIGKTALVEGLAYRIHNNSVPAAISGWRIIKINIPALLGKINVNGTEVSKLQLLINEIDKVEKQFYLLMKFIYLYLRMVQL